MEKNVILSKKELLEICVSNRNNIAQNISEENLTGTEVKYFFCYDHEDHKPNICETKAVVVNIRTSADVAVSKLHYVDLAIPAKVLDFYTLIKDEQVAVAILMDASKMVEVILFRYKDREIIGKEFQRREAARARPSLKLVVNND